MKKAYPTASLRQLALKNRLGNLVDGDPSRERMLKRFAHGFCELQREDFPEGMIDRLIDLELIEICAVAPSRPGLPFAFVRGINFELTYGCNLACNHCLQDSMRPSGRFPWIKQEAVEKRIEEAAWMGLFDKIKKGVNFTGGEIYVPGSPILELISSTAKRGISIRSNTNAWWGNRQGFTIGSRRFESDHDLIEELKHLGLSRLVLSLDQRYEQYPDLLDRVLRVASLCERTSLKYEFVATDASPDLSEKAHQSLVRILGHNPEHLLLTPMKTVDIGAAAQPSEDLLESSRLPALTRQSPCERKGFFQPEFLHVNPDGGFRSCLYAPGAGVLGNILEDSLMTILNRFDKNPVVQLYGQQSLEEFVVQSIKPWEHEYRPVEHPCAASALIAKVASRVSQKQSELSRSLTTEEMQDIHQSIGSELGIRSQQKVEP
jgi:organic radical activating enzyme